MRVKYHLTILFVNEWKLSLVYIGWISLESWCDASCPNFMIARSFQHLVRNLVPKTLIVYELKHFSDLTMNHRTSITHIITPFFLQSGLGFTWIIYTNSFIRALLSQYYFFLLSLSQFNSWGRLSLAPMKRGWYPELVTHARYTGPEHVTSSYTQTRLQRCTFCGCLTISWTIFNVLQAWNLLCPDIRCC